MAVSREQKVMNLLGMAQKAGRIASGAFAVEQAMKQGTAKYLIIAADAAEDTRSALEELANRQKIPFSIILTKELLGHCLGKEYRAVATLLDDGFSKALGKLMMEERKI